MKETQGDTRCTWNDFNDTRCTQVATKPQRSKDGEVWANLCDEHARQLDEATDYLLAENRDPGADREPATKGAAA